MLHYFSRHGVVVILQGGGLASWLLVLAIRGALRWTHPIGQLLVGQGIAERVLLFQVLYNVGIHHEFGGCFYEGLFPTGANPASHLGIHNDLLSPRRFMASSLASQSMEVIRLLGSRRRSLQ